MSLASELEGRIESAYRLSGNTLGWRLLYSGPEVLEGASVAAIGINPGGDSAPSDHATFAMPAGGSAYRDESWPLRTAPLQQQMLALFGMLQVQSHEVLAGNLVPFRSPSWAALEGKAAALRFGEALWADILREARPSLVIALGSHVYPALARILRAEEGVLIPTGWGSITATAAVFSGGRLVGLPHLSQFKLFSRPACRPALQRLFVHDRG